MSFSVAGFEISGPVLALGAITGMIYGVLAVGLVLVYRSNRLINFAHGEIGAFAAKSQAGPAPLPFGRNSGVSPTDVVIGCSAMLDAVNLAVFELGAWQAMPTSS